MRAGGNDHMRVATTLLALALIGGAGCKKKNETATEGSGSAEMGSGSAGSAAAGSGSAAMAGSDTGSGSAAQFMSHRAVNCPSTVLNAVTKAEVKGKDLILTVSSTDTEAIATIQKRTDAMLESRTTKRTPGEAHDQRGTHGQTMGLCPVHVPDDATAKAEHAKDGVVVTITPKDPAALKAEIDVRIQKAADWVKTNGGGTGNGDGTGSGKGDGTGGGHGKGKKQTP
jgi:hypothetical protein